MHEVFLSRWIFVHALEQTRSLPSAVYRCDTQYYILKTHTHTINLYVHSAMRSFIYTDEMSTIKQSLLEKEKEMEKLKQKLLQNYSLIQELKSIPKSMKGICI